MVKAFFVLFLNCYCQLVHAQPEVPITTDKISRPKLVVGIVVDQMRWDYLYRYYDRYDPKGGFKRLITQGFSCDNTLIPYIPTITACGHSCIYTGSVPAISGIAGNSWWDYNLGKDVYCTDDSTVKTVGNASVEVGRMSPRNLLVTTIGDELKLATNFRSKVIGIALKDRGGILPAGHSANAAYWYDGRTGDWISSTYYMTELPDWAKSLNSKKLVDKYFSQDWNTLYPINTYTMSSADDVPWEGKPFGANAKGFPYNLKQFVGKNYGLLPVTPYGNNLTVEMAKAAVLGEKLGADGETDLLAVSFSSPDYIGHTFGPNSVEAEDGFLRLDKALGELFNFLDEKVGKGEWLAFLSADHGAAHAPGFLKDHKIPAAIIDPSKMEREINDGLKERFGVDKLIMIEINNYQIYLDRNTIRSNKNLNETEIKKWVLNYLAKQPSVSRAVDLEALGDVALNARQKEMIGNGYYPSRSGDILIMFLPQYIEGVGNTGTTHGAWNPYDDHIPLLWYGWNIKPGKTNRETYMTDIAPTICALLHIQMPSGSIGHVIGGMGN